jgi:Lon protease-like protein
MFPLQSALLPGDILPLRVFEPRYSRLVQDCLAADDPAFGVVLISRGWEVGGGDTRSDVGAMARIEQHVDLEGGQHELIAVIGERIRVLRWLADDPYPRAVVEAWPDEPGPAVGPEQISVVVDRILALYQRVAQVRGMELRPDALAVEMEGAAMAQVCADFGCPLGVLRTVSDRADDAAHVDFGRFVDEVAAEYSRDIVLAALAGGLGAAKA